MFLEVAFRSAKYRTIRESNGWVTNNAALPGGTASTTFQSLPSLSEIHTCWVNMSKYATTWKERCHCRKKVMKHGNHNQNHRADVANQNKHAPLSLENIRAPGANLRTEFLRLEVSEHWQCCLVPEVRKIAMNDTNDASSAGRWRRSVEFKCQLGVFWYGVFKKCGSTTPFKNFTRLVLTSTYRSLVQIRIIERGSVSIYRTILFHKTALSSHLSQCERVISFLPLNFSTSTSHASVVVPVSGKSRENNCYRWPNKNWNPNTNCHACHVSSQS